MKNGRPKSVTSVIAGNDNRSRAIVLGLVQFILICSHRSDVFTLLTNPTPFFYQFFVTGLPLCFSFLFLYGIFTRLFVYFILPLGPPLVFSCCWLFIHTILLLGVCCESTSVGRMTQASSCIHLTINSNLVAEEWREWVAEGNESFSIY